MDKEPKLKSTTLRFTPAAERQLQSFVRIVKRSDRGQVFVFYIDDEAKPALNERLRKLIAKGDLPSLQFVETTQEAQKWYHDIMETPRPTSVLGKNPEGLPGGLVIDVNNIRTVQEEVSTLTGAVIANDTEPEPALDNNDLLRGLGQLSGRMQGPIVFVVSKSSEDEFAKATIDSLHSKYSYHLDVIKAV